MSEQSSLTITIAVAQSPEAAFAAIIEPQLWWSGEHQGSSHALGDSFTYRYKDLHYSRQEVTEFVAGKRLAWRVTEADISFLADRTEWEGTTITFDIAPKGNGAEIVFTHVGLKPMVECYDVCTDAWTSLIAGSLKTLIDTGKTEMIALAEPA